MIFYFTGSSSTATSSPSAPHSSSGSPFSNTIDSLLASGQRDVADGLSLLNQIRTNTPQVFPPRDDDDAEMGSETAHLKRGAEALEERPTLKQTSLSSALAKSRRASSRLKTRTTQSIKPPPADPLPPLPPSDDEEEDDNKDFMQF